MNHLAHIAKDIFDRVLELDSARERKDLLDRECATDDELRATVEKLLSAYEQADEFLELPPRGFPVASEPPIGQLEQFPAQIGPYTVREQIGEGGMGIVYVAEQIEPVQRKVALKIIKPGMETKEVIARFEAERQALAFMDHPNIARVLDAGATESGRSYFVMELVRGIPITEYCDQVKTSPRERLELFITVCDAVQHAHLKGIIHRDIKPSNVLVTQANGNPVVKVIDFGLAKATSGQRLTDKTLYTGFMRLMGTPVYMSPEQAGLSSQDVDTRSDTYSLGVLLYELLTGTTPLDKSEIAKQAYDEWCRHVREVEPPKPSTRFSTLTAAERSEVARLRQVDSNGLRQMLDGDLDQVVLKALEKDRDRRYSSPRELALDVARVLQDKPVHAVPPSAWYLTRKYVRRHKVAILAGMIFVSFLVLTTVFSSWQAMRATKASRIAIEQTAAATASEQRALKSEGLALSAQEKAKEALRVAGVARIKAERISEQQRRQHYASDMQLADHLWHSNAATPRQIQEVLADWIPTDGEPDLRDYAWRLHWTRLHLGAERTVNNTRTVTISPRGNLVVADASGIREWNESAGSFVVRWQGDASAGGEQVALSPCGRWAAIHNRIYDNPAILLVEIASGKVIRQAKGNRARFATGGDHVMVWRDDSEAGQFVEYEMWNMVTGTSRSLEYVVPRFDSVGSIAPTGASFGFGIDDNLLELHLAGRSIPYVWSAEQYGSTTWSPDGQLFVSGHRAGGQLYFRRVDNLEDKLRVNTGRLDIRSIAFSADSKRLAVGGDGTVDFYDVSHLQRTGDVTERPPLSSFAPPECVRFLHAHIADVNRIVFSQDGTTIATRDDSGTAKLWDLSKTFGIYPLQDEIEFPNSGSPGLRVEDSDGEVRVTHLPTSATMIDGDIRVDDRIVAVSSDLGIHQVDASTDAYDVQGMLSGPPGSVVELHVADASSQEQRTVLLKRVFMRQQNYWSFAFTGKRDEIAVSSEHGAFSRTLQGDINQFYPAQPWILSVSPDRRLLALVDMKELILWDLHENKLRCRLPASVGVHPTPNFGAYGVVSFSPDGNYIALGTGFHFNAAANKRSDLRVWDASTLKEIGDPLFENSTCNSAIAFSPDSKFLIAADHRGTLRIWRTTDWELEGTLNREHSDMLVDTLSVDVSPDSRFVAQGGYHGLVIWDFHTRTPRHRMRSVSITDVDFSPDGRTIIATLLDGKGKVGMWDMDTGALLCSLEAGEANAQAFELSPDGSSLAVLGSDGTIWMGKVASMERIDRHPSIVTALVDRGESQLEDEQYSAAEATLSRVLRLQSESATQDQRDIAVTRKHLLRSLKELGKLPVVIEQPQTQRVRLGESVQLSVNAASSNVDQTIRYQWFFGQDPIESATTSTLEITEITSAQCGRYHVEVRVGPSDVELGVESNGAFVIDASNPVAKGGLKKDIFLNIPNSKSRSLSALIDSPKFPHEPDATGSIGAFELPSDFGEHHGVRIHGFIIPPKSGDYVFYLLSDRSSQLFLSNDASPDNQSRIASVTGHNAAPREWQTLGPDNISRPIKMQAGKRYWVEALFRQKKFGGHFAVTWQMPGESPPKNGALPIPGEFLEFQLE